MTAYFAIRLAIGVLLVAALCYAVWKVTGEDPDYPPPPDPADEDIPREIRDADSSWPGLWGDGGDW